MKHIALLVVCCTFLVQGILITEIMYNPRQTSSLFQFIELHNEMETQVDISNWRIPEIKWTAAAGTVLQPKAFFIISRNASILVRAYPHLVTERTLIGEFSETLQKTQALTLQNSVGATVFSVSYSSKLPWSPLANGFGSSLELMCFVADQVNPSPVHRWGASTVPDSSDTHLEYGGSPGRYSTYMACLRPDADFLPPRITFSEIMYHSVNQTTIEDVMEFIEIFNLDNTTSISLDEWRIISKKGQVRFHFPLGVVIKPGAYVVIAKDPAAFSAVYSVSAAVHGGYSGELDNGDDTVALVNNNNQVIDLLQYEDGNDWPVSADALGASKKDLPGNSPFKLNYESYSKKGRTLSRNRWEWPTDEAYNWRGADPSPGLSNVEFTEPLPSIVSVKLSKKIEPDKPFSLTFSVAPVSLTTSGTIIARVEYFVLDVIANGVSYVPAQFSNAVVTNSGADYTATFTGFPVNSLVKYRIVLTMGINTIVSPRSDDPFRWHILFVAPPNPSSSPNYHLFIKPSDWGSLNTNIDRPINQRMVDGCTVRPEWQSTVPCIMAIGNTAVECRARYQGSWFNRGNGVTISDWKYPGPTTGQVRGLSWHIKLPRYSSLPVASDLILNKMYFGCVHLAAPLFFRLQDFAGIGASDVSFVRLNINGGYFRYYMTLMDGEALAKKHVKMINENCPFQRTEPLGTFYKSSGSEEMGPYGPGNLIRLPPSTACPQYSESDRYKYVYPISTNTWHNHSNWTKFMVNFGNLRYSRTWEEVRAWMETNFNLQRIMLELALSNWAAAWDNGFHNMFYFQSLISGAFEWISWDADYMFGERDILIGQTEEAAAKYDLFGGDNLTANAQTFNLLKFWIYAAYDQQFREVLRVVNSHIATPENMNKLMAAVIAEFNVTDARASAGGSPINYDRCVAQYRNYFTNRQNYVRSSLGNPTTANINSLLNEYKCPPKPSIVPTFSAWKGRPGTPAKPLVTGINGNLITLSWPPTNPNGFAVVYYNIFRADNAGEWVSVGSILGSDSGKPSTRDPTFTDTYTWSAQTSPYVLYRVAAVNQRSYSSRSLVLYVGIPQNQQQGSVARTRNPVYSLSTTTNTNNYGTVQCTINNFIEQYFTSTTSVTYSTTIQPTFTKVRVETRLAYIDDWRGELLALYINNNLVWTGSSDNSNYAVTRSRLYACGAANIFDHFELVTAEVEVPLGTVDVSVRLAPLNPLPRPASMSFGVSQFRVSIYQ